MCQGCGPLVEAAYLFIYVPNNWFYIYVRWWSSTFVSCGWSTITIHLDVFHDLKVSLPQDGVSSSQLVSLGLTNVGEVLFNLFLPIKIPIIWIHESMNWLFYDLPSLIWSTYALYSSFSKTLMLKTRIAVSFQIEKSGSHPRSVE